MANTRRDVWGELAQRVREMLNDLERLFRQQPAKPVRVPVPVPVRPQGRPQPGDPYR